MQNKKNRKLSHVFILLGIALVALGLIAEAVSFPWGALLGRQSIPSDPPPVSHVWVEESTALEDADYLPGEEGGRQTPESESQEPLPMQAGVIKIPKLGEADNIVEGVSPADLRLGAGHMPGTALPGQTGNCVLAGHRNTALLRHLELIGEGDAILLSDQENLYTYTVFRTMTVEPTEVWITEAIEGHETAVTLFTCTPYLISTHRLVVQADLTSVQPLD